MFSYFTQHQTEFTVKLREKKSSLANDDFAVKTPDGQLFININGPAFSLHAKKILYDAQGTPIMNIRNKVFSLRREFKVCFFEALVFIDLI